MANRGCVQPDVLCPLGQVYNRVAPTKQNLLCNEQSGIETVLNHADFQTTWESVYTAVPKKDEEPVLDLISQFTNLNETTTTTTTTTTEKLPTNLVYPVSAKNFRVPLFLGIIVTEFVILDSSKSCRSISLEEI